MENNEIGFRMTRENLQFIYELAFFPPRIHQFWNRIKKGEVKKDEAKPFLTHALSLHQALPEKGFQSKQALRKISHCQVSAKAFGTETFIINIANYLGFEIVLKSTKVPGGMIRDFQLPKFQH